MEVREALPSLSFRRCTEPPVAPRESLELRPEPRPVEGNTSFFCFEAGRISSRSTGTPKLTKNSRRMRERIQFGGWRGGAATSWLHSDALRCVRKIGVSGLASGSIEVSISSGGNIAST